MSIELFSDDCSGCRPAIVNAKTGEVFADNHPIMQKVLGVWKCTTRQERVIFHRVTCCNSRNPIDLMLFQCVALRICNAIEQEID
jgi:hypothetical protein